MVPGSGVVALELVDQVPRPRGDLVVVPGLASGLGHRGLDGERAAAHLPRPVDAPRDAPEQDLLAAVLEAPAEHAPGYHRGVEPDQSVADGEVVQLELLLRAPTHRAPGRVVVKARRADE